MSDVEPYISLHGGSTHLGQAKDTPRFLSFVSLLRPSGHCRRQVPMLLFALAPEQLVRTRSSCGDHDGLPCARCVELSARGRFRVAALRGAWRAAGYLARCVELSARGRFRVAASRGAWRAAGYLPAASARQ